jgi:hypothetical protein
MLREKLPTATAEGPRAMSANPVIYRDKFGNSRASRLAAER